MKHAKLYEIEDDIRNIIKPLGKINNENDLVLNSIIYHYTQSYMHETTFVGSALYKGKDGYFVALMTHYDIEHDFAKIDANKFLAANFNIIDLKDQKYKNGFKEYYDKKYHKPHEENMLFIRDLLNDFPNPTIPTTAYNQFSDYKGVIDKYDGRRKVVFPEMEQSEKATPLSMSEIKNSEFGLKVLKTLKEQEKYQILFEENKDKIQQNLSNKRIHNIDRIVFSDEMVDSLNKLSKINSDIYNENYYSIYKKLEREGLMYAKSISPDYKRTDEGIETLISSNNLGITGILIYAPQFYDAGEQFKNTLKAISSIAIATESRGQKLGVKLFTEAAETAKINKQILFRTTPSENGASYLENSIDNVIKNNKYHHVINSCEQEKQLAEYMVKISYGLIDYFVHDHKKYKIKTPDSPFDIVTEHIKKYRDKIQELGLSSDRYESRDEKRKLIDEVFNEFASIVKGAEIKNKNTLKL